jgi:hypothetical protein
MADDGTIWIIVSVVIAVVGVIGIGLAILGVVCYRRRTSFEYVTTLFQ